MYVIDYVIDTRSYDLETGKAIPGTGELRSCDFCSARHEIHAYVRDPATGERKVCGSTCAKSHAYDKRNTLKHAGRALPRKIVRLSDVPLKREFWAVVVVTYGAWERIEDYFNPALSEEEVRALYLERVAQKYALAIRWA